MYSQHTKDGKNDQPKDANINHRNRRLGIDKTDHRLHCYLLAEPRLVEVLGYSTVEQMTGLNRSATRPRPNSKHIYSQHKALTDRHKVKSNQQTARVNVETLQKGQFGPNSIHHRLSRGQRTVASRPYVNATEPHLQETHNPEATQAHITSRLQTGAVQGRDGNKDPQEDQGKGGQQQDQLAVIGRGKYNKTCQWQGQLYPTYGREYKGASSSPSSTVGLSTAEGRTTRPVYAHTDRDRPGTKEDERRNDGSDFKNRTVIKDYDRRSEGSVFKSTWHDYPVSKNTCHDCSAFKTIRHGGADDGSGVRSVRQDCSASKNTCHDYIAFKSIRDGGSDLGNRWHNGSNSRNTRFDCSVVRNKKNYRICRLLKTRADPPGKEVAREEGEPLQTFGGHKSKGFALDWSRAKGGVLGSGDCSDGTHVRWPGTNGTRRQMVCKFVLARQANPLSAKPCAKTRGGREPKEGRMNASEQETEQRQEEAGEAGHEMRLQEEGPGAAGHGVRAGAESRGPARSWKGSTRGLRMVTAASSRAPGTTAPTSGTGGTTPPATGATHTAPPARKSATAASYSGTRSKTTTGERQEEKPGEVEDRDREGAEYGEAEDGETQEGEPGETGRGVGAGAGYGHDTGARDEYWHEVRAGADNRHGVGAGHDTGAGNVYRHEVRAGAEDGHGVGAGGDRRGPTRSWKGSTRGLQIVVSD